LFAATGGCGDSADADSSSSNFEAVPPRHHSFVLQTKGFIAPIKGTALGELPGDLIRPAFVKNAALRAFAAATNLAFSENPPDGTHESAKFRSWVELQLDVTCTGTKAALTVRSSQADAGFEGPLHGGIAPLIIRELPDGGFYYQARAWPHPAADVPFEVIQSRPSTIVWHTVTGHAVCDAKGDATLKIDPADVVRTKFPSVRIWTSKKTEGKDVYSMHLDLEQAQGNFAELWNLPKPPDPPAEAPSGPDPNAPSDDDPMAFCDDILDDSGDMQFADECRAMVGTNDDGLPPLTDDPITF
jgi:hypothetical protein